MSGRAESQATRGRFVRNDAPVIIVAIAIFATCYALMTSKGIYSSPLMLLGNLQVYAAGIFVMLSAEILWRLVCSRPESPIQFIRETYFTPDLRSRWINGLPILLMLLAFMPFYSKMKSMIPLFNSYDWDATFIEWDKALFFGADGWRVLQPVIGYPIITSAISLCYQVWILLIYPGCLYFCFYKVDADVRRRFFLTFILCWTVIGAALATAFASYGPCFIEPLAGNPHFHELMDYLNSANEQFPVMALPVQQLLLDWFHSDARGLGSGITAMPSMHVSIAFLFFLAMRHVHPVAGRAFLVFFVIILIGSVHLAYHYAVDGLVSIIVTWLLWLGTTYFFRWWDALIFRSIPEAEVAATG